MENIEVIDNPRCREIKRNIARDFCSNEIGFKLNQKRILLIHSVPFEFTFSSQEISNWVEKLLPSALHQPNQQVLKEKPIQVAWLDVRLLTSKSLGNWTNDADPELESFEYEGKEVAIQRDFLGFLSPNKATIYCYPGLDDSLYNALRWLLPRYLLEKQMLMLHSSCMVGSSNRASVFLGPSGAGKTTTVSRLKERLILGDDMIMVSVEKGRAYAESAALGQNPKFQGPIGQKFPIDGFYFLNKGKVVAKKPSPQLVATRKFFSSILYPTWKTTDQIDQIISLSQVFLHLVSAWELTLDTKTPFLGLVDG